MFLEDVLPSPARSSRAFHLPLTRCTLDLNKINLRERRQMLTQGISMWLTARAGWKKGARKREEAARYRGKRTAPKSREIVGSYGASLWRGLPLTAQQSRPRFESFANQIAIIDGNNHTANESLRGPPSDSAVPLVVAIPDCPAFARSQQFAMGSLFSPLQK